MKSGVYSSILVKKLLQNFTKPQLKEYFSPGLINSIEKGSSPELYIISRKISPSTIGYTINDFITDNPKCRNFKEREFLFNLLSKGISIRHFSVENNLTERGFLSALKNGFKSCNNIAVLIATGNFNFSKDEFLRELSAFKIILKENFVKLIGYCDELEKFKLKYLIDFDITAYIDSYKCLAFDGYIFEVIVTFQKDIH